MKYIRPIVGGIIAVEVIYCVMTGQWDFLPLLGCVVSLLILHWSEERRATRLQGIVDHMLQRTKEAP